MMKYYWVIIISSLATLQTFGQSSEDTTRAKLVERIFLPALDVGYQSPNSDLIGSSVKFSTAVEYRFRNNNDFFIRLSYDTYGAKYDLPGINDSGNSLEGTVQFQDITLAPGYRFGDRDFRLMFSYIPGIKLYQFPEVFIDGQSVRIEQDDRSLFTTTALVTLEYYFDEKSAITLSFFQHQVWNKVDYWVDGRSAIGISLGFITSLL